MSDLYELFLKLDVNEPFRKAIASQVFFQGILNKATLVQRNAFLMFLGKIDLIKIFSDYMDWGTITSDTHYFGDETLAYRQLLFGCSYQKF